MERTTIFFVFAVNNAGRSRLSLFRSIPLQDMSIPSQPTDLQVLNTSGSSVSLIWRHPLGEVRINVSTTHCLNSLFKKISVQSRRAKTQPALPLATAMVQSALVMI